jgi:spore maturation protein CgeB
MRLAFYGSSLLSGYWNGAATYYRGLIRALSALGVETTFYEPDAFDRQAHRDIEPPGWARVVVWPATEAGLRAALSEARAADVVVKASGVGVFDDALVEGALREAAPQAARVFWDVDAPATLAALAEGREPALKAALPRFDAVLTYGGGDPVIRAYAAEGARFCAPIYNALDPDTHHPVPPDPRFAADLAFLGNRLPDREARVEAFLFEAARARPEARFLLGGAGWEPDRLPANVRHLGHVGAADHNAFNVTPRAVLNVSRASMAATGWSPATRVFEAAGAGACLVTDAWEGLDMFLTPDREVLVARDGAELAAHLDALTPGRAAEIGAAARRRALRDHSYDARAKQALALFEDLLAARRGRRLSA